MHIYVDFPHNCLFGMKYYRYALIFVCNFRKKTNEIVLFCYFDKLLKNSFNTFRCILPFKRRRKQDIFSTIKKRARPES